MGEPAGIVILNNKIVYHILHFQVKKTPSHGGEGQPTSFIWPSSEIAGVQMLKSHRRSAGPNSQSLPLVYSHHLFDNHLVTSNYRNYAV